MQLTMLSALLTEWTTNICAKNVCSVINLQQGLDFPDIFPLAAIYAIRLPSYA